MSTWTNVPYSYMPGTNRLLTPENFATNANSQPNQDYDFQASNQLAPDATEYGTGGTYYILKAEGNAPPVPPAGPLVNFLTIDFLIKDENTGIWQINSSGNAAYGTLFLTGAQAGTIVSGTGDGVPSQATSITNLLSYKGANKKLIVSMGGATGLLSVMIPDGQSAIDLVNTIWNVLFGAASPNTLNWSNAAWGGGSTPLFFDGIDLDWESPASSPALQAFMTQWNLCQQAYTGAVGKKYLNIAPQSPNTWLNAPSSSPWTDNLLSIPFTGSQSVLSSINPGFLGGAALLSPNVTTGLRAVDYVFCQLYNQAGLYLTSPPSYTTYNPNFTNLMAQWAYLIMKARRLGANTKLIWSCASADAPEIWTDAQRSILNSAIDLINPLVSAQLVTDGDVACVPSEWSGGFGLWNSPTAQALAENVFAVGSPITTTNMSGDAVILYANQTYPSPDPEWTAPSIPIVDARVPS